MASLPEGCEEYQEGREEVRVPMWFMKWFARHGVKAGGASGFHPWQIVQARKYAWRAYQKGKRDAKNRKGEK